MANIKNFGLGGVAKDLQLGKSGGHFVYDSVNGRFDFKAADGVALEDVRAAGVESSALTFSSNLAVSVSDFVTAAMGVVNHDNDTTVPTTAAVIDFVDAQTANVDLAFSTDDAAARSVNLLTESFTFTGGTNLTTSGTGQDVTISLDDNVTLAGNISAVDAAFTGVTTAATVEAGVLNFVSLGVKDAAVVIDGIIADNTMATASATTLATSASMKSYVDTELQAMSDTGFVVSDGTTTQTVSGGETLTFEGAADQITATVSADSDKVVIGLTENVSIAGNLDVAGNITTGGGLGGSITGAALITTKDLEVGGADTAAGTITFNEFVLSGIIDDDTMATASNTTVATSESVVAYVGSQIGAADLATAGDTGTGTVNINTQSLAVAGGTNITTTAAAQGITVALDDTVVLAGDITAVTGNFTTAAVSGGATVGQDLTVTGAATVGAGLAVTGASTVTGDLGVTGTFTSNNITSENISLAGNASVTGDLSVAGKLFSDDITAAAITVDGNATITGNLTVSGTTTTVNSTEVNIADSAIVVNSEGVIIKAGLKANVAGVIHSLLFEPGTIPSPDTNIEGAWVLSDDLYMDGKTIHAGRVNASSVKLTGAVTVTDIIDSAADFALTSTDTTLATSKSVKDYVDSQVGGVSALNLAGDNATTGSVDMTSDSLTVLGGVGITTGVNGTNITVDLDDTAVTAGAYGDATNIPVITIDAQGRITNATTAAVSSTLSIADDNAGTDTVSLIDGTLTFAGTANQLVATVSDDQVKYALADSVNVVADVTAGGTVTGTTSVVSPVVDAQTSLTVNGFTVTGITNDMATTAADTLATSQSVKDYVTNNSGDGLIVRGSVTADSAASTFMVGTLPAIAGRTYVASRVKIKVASAFSGNAFDHVVVKAGATTLVAEADADALAAGTYMVELDDAVITGGTNITVEAFQADGTTATAPTAGDMVVAVEYNWTA